LVVVVVVVVAGVTVIMLARVVQWYMLMVLALGTASKAP
jgi:hypothetical protein